MRVPAGEFKAKCLQLMDMVKKYHKAIIITKFGKPVARLMPLEEEAEKPIYGFLKGTVEIKGNIIEPTGESWDADK